MPIQTSCPHCAKRFQVKEEFLGRKAKCAACQQAFVIERCEDEAVLGFKDERVDKPRQATAPRSAVAPAPPPVSRPAPSAQGAAAGHLPSFDDVLDAAEKEAALPDFDALADAAQSERQATTQNVAYAVPTLPPPLPVQRKRTTIPVLRKPAGSTRHADGNLTARIILIGLASVALIYLAGFAFPPLIVVACGLLLISGIACYIWGAIGCLITPFRESVMCGLACMIVPFYSLYYLLSRWDDMKGPVGRSVGGILLILAGAFGSSLPAMISGKASSAPAASGTPFTTPSRPAPAPRPAPSPAMADRAAANPPAPTPPAPRTTRRPVADAPAPLPSGPAAESKLKVIAASWQGRGSERDLFEYEREADGTLLLPRSRRFTSTNKYTPPVSFQMILHTDRHDTRFAYGAQQVILNWEMGANQLRIDGGPAAGRHKPGVGPLPRDEWVGLEWAVKPNEAILYIDGVEKYRTSADFSAIDEPFRIWCHNGDAVLKDIRVVQLAP